MEEQIYGYDEKEIDSLLNFLLQGGDTDDDSSENSYKNSSEISEVDDHFISSHFVGAKEDNNELFLSKKEAIDYLLMLLQ